MGTYNEKFENLAKSVYTKIMEVATQQVPITAQQQVPAQQPVAQQAAPEQPVGQTAIDQTIGAEQSAQEVPVETQGAEVGGDEAIGAEETQEIGDEIGMSEIQEMAGQLAQMLREFKASNPEESVEAAKFAAGMVVAAAIDGMKYKERKDILKKIKAGDFNYGEDGQSEVEQKDIEQPAEGEGVVTERLRKDNKEESELRKDLKPKEKKNRRSEKSPFSGINESGATVDYNTNVDTPDKIDTAKAAASNAGEQDIVVNPTNPNVKSTGLQVSGDTTMTAVDNARKGVATKLTAESVIFKKSQFDQIRLKENKTKYYRFTKSQLLEAMRG